MPFRSPGRTYYKTRVSLPDGREIVAGCGTDSYEVACEMELMVKVLKRPGKWKPLEMLIAGRIKLPALFDAYSRETLADFMAALDSPDISKLLDEWKADERYKMQVRQFVTPGFPASNFTKGKISTFLAGLAHSGSTKNRYRAALSVFAKWLVEREVIPHNPLRDVQGFKPNPPRMAWLDREQAKALVMSLGGMNRAIEALMACTGIEWQVIPRLMRRDVDLGVQTVHARGGKTAWRDRVVRSTEPWAWAIFAEWCTNLTPNAPIFPGADKSRVLRVHKRISKRLGLPETTLHDWRHTYAVLSLKDGLSAQVIAHQLGHRDSYLVLTRYGRHIPDLHDYTARPHATHSFQSEGREERKSS